MEWCRSTALGQSLIEVLDGMVDAKELTDAEAISLLKCFEESFDASLASAPAAHYSTGKEVTCELRGNIETKNRCAEHVHLTLSECRLVEDGVETDLGKTKILLVDGSTTG